MQICIHKCQSLGRKTMDVLFCLRDELHLKIGFVAIFKPASRQYEKYWCIYVRRKKSSWSFHIFICYVNQKE